MINELEVIYNDHIDTIYLTNHNGLLVSDYNLYYDAYQQLTTFNNKSIEIRINGNKIDKTNFLLLDLSNPTLIKNNLSESKSSSYKEYVYDTLGQKIDPYEIEVMLEEYLQSKEVNYDLKQFSLQKFIDTFLEVSGTMKFDDKIKSILSSNIFNDKYVFVLTDQEFTSSDNVFFFSKKVMDFNIFFEQHQIFSYDIDSLATIYQKDNLQAIDNKELKVKLSETYFIK